ncbi:hypothetical protein [Solwaraspora sp. WMMD792]|uniref:hypothetical protein n=1 Tax=Solwaraspora sp. WMMD792 TaxID=3016099 RepID=UPI002416C221|nr:hypothetical protein [Solwaraspora sp. WMMD792]MDG4770681.1 hypothetical protein [Solwaraspora sp. WMMD792]
MTTTTTDDEWCQRLAAVLASKTAGRRAEGEMTADQIAATTAGRPGRDGRAARRWQAGRQRKAGRR